MSPGGTTSVCAMIHTRGAAVRPLSTTSRLGRIAAGHALVRRVVSDAPTCPASSDTTSGTSAFSISPMPPLVGSSAGRLHSSVCSPMTSRDSRRSSRGRQRGHSCPWSLQSGPVRLDSIPMIDGRTGRFVWTRRGSVKFPPARAARDGDWPENIAAPAPGVNRLPQRERSPRRRRSRRRGNPRSPRRRCQRKHDRGYRNSSQICPLRRTPVGESAREKREHRGGDAGDAVDREAELQSGAMVMRSRAREPGQRPRPSRSRPPALIMKRAAWPQALVAPRHEDHTSAANAVDDERHRKVDSAGCRRPSQSTPPESGGAVAANASEGDARQRRQDESLTRHLDALEEIGHRRRRTREPRPPQREVLRASTSGGSRTSPRGSRRSRSGSRGGGWPSTLRSMAGAATGTMAATSSSASGTRLRTVIERARARGMPHSKYALRATVT